MLCLSQNAHKNKKPAGALCASGLMSALFSESLCTPQQARRVAVVTMVPMRLADDRGAHSEKRR
jgi:hypothetical protein